MKSVFLPHQAASKNGGPDFFWECASETLTWERLGPQGHPLIWVWVLSHPVILGSWLWRPLWASSHLGPALDGIGGLVHHHLVLGEIVGEPISQHLHDFRGGALQTESLVPGPEASGPVWALPLRDMPVAMCSGPENKVKRGWSYKMAEEKWSWVVPSFALELSFTHISFMISQMHIRSSPRGQTEGGSTKGLIIVLRWQALFTIVTQFTIYF